MVCPNTKNFQLKSYCFFCLIYNTNTNQAKKLTPEESNMIFIAGLDFPHNVHTIRGFQGISGPDIFWYAHTYQDFHVVKIELLVSNSFTPCRSFLVL